MLHTFPMIFITLSSLAEFPTDIIIKYITIMKLYSLITVYMTLIIYVTLNNIKICNAYLFEIYETGARCYNIDINGVHAL